VITCQRLRPPGPDRQAVKDVTQRPRARPKVSDSERMAPRPASDFDLEYYDELFEPGAYLKSHAEHFARWHGSPAKPTR
jgi:hypothetical protein